MNRPHWNPARVLGYPRDLWRRDMKLRVLVGVVLLDEPLLIEGSPETRGVPSWGAGPSQNGTCSGGGIGRKIRAGRSTEIIFGSRGPESAYASQSEQE